MCPTILVLAAVVGTNYGYEPLSDGSGMKYLIQIEPQLVDLLEAGEPIRSYIPPEAREVRAYRISVGEGDLPREADVRPSLPGPIPAGIAPAIGTNCQFQPLSDGSAGTECMIQIGHDQIDALKQGTPIEGSIPADVTEVRACYIFVGKEDLPGYDGSRDDGPLAIPMHTPPTPADYSTTPISVLPDTLPPAGIAGPLDESPVPPLHEPLTTLPFPTYNESATHTPDLGSAPPLYSEPSRETTSPLSVGQPAPMAPGAPRDNSRTDPRKMALDVWPNDDEQKELARSNDPSVHRPGSSVAAGPKGDLPYPHNSPAGTITQTGYGPPNIENHATAGQQPNAGSLPTGGPSSTSRDSEPEKPKQASGLGSLRPIAGLDNPWTLAATTCTFGSLGGMLYAAMIAWDYRRRYRTLLDRLVDRSRVRGMET